MCLLGNSCRNTGLHIFCNTPCTRNNYQNIRAEFSWPAARGSYEAAYLVVIKASKWETGPAQWNSIPKTGGRNKNTQIRCEVYILGKETKRKFGRFFFKNGTYVGDDALGCSNVGRGMGLRGCDSDSLSESVGRRPDEKRERAERSRGGVGGKKSRPLSQQHDSSAFGVSKKP